MKGTERVHVSLAELRTAASRALAGVGAPAGAERDGARSVVWLEARRLRGAAALLTDLRASSGSAPRPPNLVGNRVDLAGCPILIWGSTLIETAMLEAGAPIVLEGCPSPRALLPEAAAQAAQAGPNLHFTLQAGASRALIADGETILDRSFADLDTSDIHLLAAPGRPRAPLPGAAAPRAARLSARELDARYGASLANGLRLSPGDWREIREAAARILVPATDRSHSRGAGAEVDDNE